MLPRNKKIGLLLLGLVFYLVSSEIVVVSALQCSHCDGEDCDDPEVKDCANENDQCYIRLDETLDFIGMGCASTLGNETEIINLIKNKQLYVCSTADCNGFENLPQINECTVCDSATDEKCAVQPATAGTSRRCAAVPFTQCYERVNIANGGTTERGCLNELEGDDFYNCLSGEDENCKVCTESGCNTEIVPAGRQQCQRCDSDTDSNCSSAPSALSTCPTYSSSDTCVSVYESGVTRRGCASEFTCDATARNCEICSANGCNKANVKKRAEELYGIFQDLPLNCYTCVHEDCESSKGLLRKCEGDLYQDCWTVFDAAGAVMQRGCEASISAEHQSHCATNPALCFNCKANGCNNNTEVKTKEQCLYCDTAVNADCAANTNAITSTRECVDGCVTALYERESNPNVFELARTCFEDVEFDDREVCTEANNCVQCTGEKCNTALVPAEGRLSCLHCNGDDCDSPVSSVCSVYSTSDQCYIFFDNVTYSAVRMGCKSSVSADEIYNDIMHYFLCDGDDCNDYDNLPEAHICYVCDSATDVNCAISPTSITNQVRCQIHPHTDCFTRISDDGHTVRGCISTLNSTEFLSCHEGTPGEYCRVCSQSNCNVNIYPSGRQRCYRCNSLDDPECAESPINSTTSACPLYDSDDVCVTKLSDGIVHRGCGTELECDEGKDSKTCRTCEKSNCNDYVFTEYPIGNPGIFQDLPLNCYNCNGTECSSSLGNIRKCENNIYQTCTSVFNATDGQIIGRGCSDAWEEACADNENNCHNCKSNGCNVAKTTDDYIDCIFCDAQVDERCLTDVSQIEQTRACYKSCVTALYNRTSDATPVRELIRTCLDDMDLDDREICADGKDVNCKACTEENCNDASVGERISCYQCVGDECQIPVAKTCRAVTEGDQCFVEYDENRSIVELGCKSKYDPAEVKERIIAKRLWLCDGENCNSIDATPSSQPCVICNSITDADCAIAPQDVTSQTTCARSPYTQCYSRVLSDGHTERGCLSSIEGEDFYDCLLGANTTECLVCVGSGCNSAIFPQGRRSCQRCNSKDDPTCQSSPNAPSVCPIYDEDAFCTTKLDNGYIYRGCSSEFQCDDTDRLHCRYCNLDNCNTVDLNNLGGLDVGEPGKWQDLPLTCYSCIADDCLNSAGTLHECEYNNLQTCQTVFGADGAVVRRGCSDDVLATHEEYCENNAGKCLGCKSNNCNNATSLDQYVHCYSCDSAKDAQCALDFVAVNTTHRICQGHCAVALYPRSSSVNPSYELARTCLDDLELDDREKCLAGEHEFCVACEGALCNTASLPENRHKCYTCVDNECTDYDVAECSAYQPNDQCYISFDAENSILGMGCRSDLESDVITELIKQKILLLCDGEACNGVESIPTAKTCSVCDSESDERCATNPNLVTDTERCSNLPYTNCYTRVKEDGHTARGCLANLPEDTFYNCLYDNSTLCETCTGDKCNGLDVYPTGRWQCQQCSSDTDPLCSSTPDSNKICPIYNENDGCVTNLRDGITTRGCASSLRCDDESDRKTCRICNTSGCNTVDLEKSQEQGEPGRWQDVPITCRTCEGEADCESLGNYRVCTSNVYQSCMTVFNTDGKVIQRGCSDAVEENNNALCSANPENCLRCNSNGCNNSTRLADYIDCVYCDTDSNANCGNNVSAVTQTRKCNTYCVTALFPKYDELNPAYGLARTCFDDLEYDDREACAAGQKEHCQVCAEAKCNTQSVPETRLSCNVCQGDDCQDPQPQSCAAYREGDQCYIQFDEERSIVGFGCRSEFTNAEADYLLQNKRLFYCDGDNCNTFDALPVAQNCKICNSRTDLNCATNPDSVTATTRCSYLPYTECYTRILDGGVTERGCLSSLYDDDFGSCLNGTAPHCQACKGDSCNNDVYPEDRLSCHICDSITDPTCTSKPDSVSVCPLHVDGDSCVTAYSDDVTYRGCSSSVRCDASQPRSCLPCEGAACNTINLSRRQDDNFGKWQDLPLSCLSCNGTSCAAVNNVESATCANNNEQDCVTVFQSGAVVSRGCSDAIEEEYGDYCDANPEDCLNCKSNSCNNATALTQYNECIYCDTLKNLSCLWDPESAAHKTRQCQGGCMTALYPSDSSSDPGYELIRTCLDDKEAADRANCNDEQCQSCVGSKCNSATVPAERLSCYQCAGDDCDEPELKLCPLYKSEDKCFTWFDETNSISQMGCVSSFHDQEITAIISTKRVLVCEGDACNSLNDLPRPQNCAVCDSSTDYTCAVNAQEISTFNTCNVYPYTNCYTKLISTDGSTTRGCLSDLATTEFVDCVLGNDKNCSICIGDGCNREVFPEDRQQCYTCTSEDDDSCQSNPTRLLPCPYVAETEKCRTAVSNNITIRGCSSEILCDLNDKNCVSCNGSACNSIDLLNRAKDDGVHGVWQELPLRCHICEGEHCLQSLGPAYQCTGNTAQDCVTVFTTDGDVKRRGCFDDVEIYEQRHCRENPHLCFSCKSNECNDAWNTTDYIECNFCNSDTNPLCSTDPQNAIFPKRACNKECMVAVKGSQVIRSCLDDKELYHRNECRGNSDQCSSCNTPNCNDFVYPENYFSCHVCADASCITSVSQRCENAVDNDYCFAKYENGRPELLGCASSQNQNDLTAWEAENKLYTCQEKDCNEISRLPTQGGQCVSCNSELTPACAQNPTAVAAVSLCPALQTQCVTQLNNAGHTLRSCLSELVQSEQVACRANGTCTTCDGDKCNNAIFPSNRLKCHICLSSINENCSKDPNYLQVCPIYSSNDQCVTRHDAYTERGCKSQITCDVSDGQTCNICSGDGCNTVELTGGATVLSTVSLLTTLVFAIVAMLVIT